MIDMTFNPSFIQALAISVLILGVLVPIGVFAAPIFVHTDNKQISQSLLEPDYEGVPRL